MKYLVSIVLPVYNEQKTLYEAVDSVLKQTYSDWELLIIDDGSEDKSLKIAKEYLKRDNRVKVLRNNINQGLVYSLNKGIKAAHGEFVARMDADDISLPQRLEKQVDFLTQNPDYGLVGTWAKVVQNEKVRAYHKRPGDNTILQYYLLFNTPFTHSSVMMRKSVLDEVGLYDENLPKIYPEDYELWQRVAEVSKVANLPEVLHIYREFGESITKKHASEIQKGAMDLSLRYLNKCFESEITSLVLRQLSWLIHGQYKKLSLKQAVQLEHVVDKITEIFSKQRKLDEMKVKKFGRKQYHEALTYLALSNYRLFDPRVWQFLTFPFVLKLVKNRFK